MLSRWQHSTLRGNRRKADTHLCNMHHSNTYWLHNVICNKLLTKNTFLARSHSLVRSHSLERYLTCTTQVCVQSKGSVSLINIWERISALLIKSAVVNSGSKAFCAQRDDEFKNNETLLPLLWRKCFLPDLQLYYTNRSLLRLGQLNKQR